MHNCKTNDLRRPATENFFLVSKQWANYERPEFSFMCAVSQNAIGLHSISVN